MPDEESDEVLESDAELNSDEVQEDSADADVKEDADDAENQRNDQLYLICCFHEKSPFTLFMK